MKIPLLKFLPLLHSNLFLVDNQDLYFENENGQEVVSRLYSNGQVSYIVYYKNEDYHRPHNQGPAYLSWHLNGQVSHIEYLENGKDHRPHTQGPAVIRLHENGKISYIKYYENGNLHRPHTQGPAYVSWHENGQIYCILYYENGTEFFPAETSKTPALQ